MPAAATTWWICPEPSTPPFLAVTATIKLVGVYAWHKLFDQDPFTEPESEDSPPLLRSLAARARTVTARVALPAATRRAASQSAPASEPPPLADGED